MSLTITAYEITCAGCSTPLGTHHEVGGWSTASGVVVFSYFGLVHACDGVPDEEVAEAEVEIKSQLGTTWSPDRRRQQKVKIEPLERLGKRQPPAKKAPPRKAAAKKAPAKKTAASA